MKVLKKKIKEDVWKFVIGKTVVAVTKKKNFSYSLLWRVNGLLKIVRKKGMKGVIIGSEWFPADFTAYSKSKSSFSPKYIKNTIRKAIKEHHKSRKILEEQRIDI